MASPGVITKEDLQNQAEKMTQMVSIYRFTFVIYQEYKGN